MTGVRKRPRVEHPELPEGDSFRVHHASYSDICPTCVARARAGRDINALHAALVEFGYSSLSREEVETAYHDALAGVDPGSDIIRMMVTRQMRDAGLIKGEGE